LYAGLDRRTVHLSSPTPQPPVRRGWTPRRSAAASAFPPTPCTQGLDLAASSCSSLVNPNPLYAGAGLGLVQEHRRYLPQPPVRRGWTSPCPPGRPRNAPTPCTQGLDYLGAGAERTGSPNPLYAGAGLQAMAWACLPVPCLWYTERKRGDEPENWNR
jgi:hypothetical protein